MNTELSIGTSSLEILLQDGEPVVADFGISLALGAAGGDRITETGLSLGLCHYGGPRTPASS